MLGLLDGMPCSSTRASLACLHSAAVGRFSAIPIARCSADLYGNSTAVIRCLTTRAISLINQVLVHLKVIGLVRESAHQISLQLMSHLLPAE